MVGVTLANVLPACFPPPAAGLYYLAELIEEYTVATSRIIKYMIWVSGSFPQDPPHSCPASKGGSGESLAWVMRPVSLLFSEGITPYLAALYLVPLGLLSWA